MSLAELCVAFLNPLVIFSVVFVYITYHVFFFYHQQSKLPPGPRPIPFLGNILDLRKEGSLYEKAMVWCKEYGDPFTVWVGSRPMVIASTNESFKEISGPLRKQLAGRMETNIGGVQRRGNVSVVFSDFDGAWDTLRRLVHVTLRKYAKTEKLAELCGHLVDKVIAEILNEKNKAEHGVVDYVENVINNVLGQSAFGAGFTNGDPMYERLHKATICLERDLINGLPSDILPILGWIYWKAERRVNMAVSEFHAISDAMYFKAASTYEPGILRHFTDVLIASREQMMKDEKASAKYLTEDNLKQAISDIFIAGTGTNKTILSFALLRLANDPKLQKKLRFEIRDVLGDRHALHDDRPRLPLTSSFIDEVIRFYPPVPLALPRKALCDITMNGQSIPKGTGVLTNVYAVNRDEDIWGADAKEFKPERFASASVDQASRGFTSFGVGSRSCPGERMAQADIFYSVVRTLQKVELSCPGGEGTANLIGYGSSSDLQIAAERQTIILKKI